MKKLILIILFSTCFALSGEAQLEENILSQQDLEMQTEYNSDGPALSSALEDPNPWEAYNEWRCFATENIHLSCPIYDEFTEVPGLQIYTESANYFYDVPIEYNFDCDKTLEAWRSLIGSSQQICIFGARLPEQASEPAELWYIQKLKTEYGYWSLFPGDRD